MNTTPTTPAAEPVPERIAMFSLAPLRIDASNPKAVFLRVSEATDRAGDGLVAGILDLKYLPALRAAPQMLNLLRRLTHPAADDTDVEDAQALVAEINEAMQAAHQAAKG